MESKDIEKPIGEPIGKAPDKPAGKVTGKPIGKDAGETRQSEADAARPGSETLPAMDFSTFILSLSSSVLMHLGEIKNPTTDENDENHAMARHTIDIISMLDEKTRGNLNGDEEKLIKGVLYDLRMRYCKATET